MITRGFANGGELDTPAIDEILTYLCEDLGGDWLLTGGALVRLQFDPARGTEDMDLVWMRHPDLSDNGAKQRLFKWLIARGSGPEWVNSTVEPLVRGVSGWRNEVVELSRGRKGSVCRPTLTLFIYLKLRRGTEIDLQDIRTAVSKCPEGFDEAKLKAWADAATWERFVRERGRLGI